MNTMHQHLRGKRRFLFIPIFIAGLFAMSAIVMLLWNAVLPKVTGALPMDYWQAMAIFVLSRILFSGFKFRGYHGHARPFMHPTFRNKFMEMTEDEKEQFKSQWKQRCCK